MKNFTFLLILIICLSLTSCGQTQLKYDFSKIKSHSDTKALIVQMQLENEDEKIDSISDFQEITLKGMHYAGIPIKSALITDHYTILTTDTINFSGKKLLETIESEKGLTSKLDTYSDDIVFEWKEETEDKKIAVKLVNGKHLASLGDKDNAELTITFKPAYDIPMANIHKKVKTFERQPEYKLNISANGCVFDVILNGITLGESSSKNEFFLNNYLTDENSTIKIIAKPKIINGDKNFKSFSENSYFSASITDKTSDTNLKIIESVRLTGNSPAVFELDFNSKLPIYPKAWTEGTDLRNDKNLNDKIIALYDKLGNAILQKDEQAVNDILYQRRFDLMQSNFITDFQTSRDYWELLLEIQRKTYKYTTAKDFDIEYNADGKLIWVFPKDKSDMIIYTGKQFNHSMNYYLYQPKGSNELKIIR